MLTPQKGEVIAGRYHLEREIARGGMGSVWSGRDAKLRRNVAVKLVAPESQDAASERDARERFEREAMAAAQLQSPHVVQVFDFGVERGYPYIVMELLEGEDLRTRLHTIKRVSLEVAAQILVQTAKALSVAHAAGVIHRDLKPGNIFLVRAAEEELVKILDFGVAKSSGANLLEVTAEEEVMGTPQFMSPEQARGIEVDHRADLWSLGVIIYKALTGHLPFRGRTPTSVIVKVCTTDPQPVSDLAPDLPRELDDFFRRALAREREQRFASAREMALAFSRITPITFTTLSMPDPKEIEAAIAEAQAQARAAADDDAPTMAMDYESLETMAIEGSALFDDGDQFKTSVHVPAALPLALKPPSPPPRRSGQHRRDDGLIKPLPAAGRPATPSSLPLPRTPKGSRPSLDASLAARSSQELVVPLPEPSEPTLDREGPDSVPASSAVPSAPVLLSRPSLVDLPSGPTSSARATPPPLPVRNRPASTPQVDASQVDKSQLDKSQLDKSSLDKEPPSGPLRPSTPTLRGVGEHESTPPPAARGTRPALIMALAAVCVGVICAWILSAVLGNERGAVAADIPEEVTPAQTASPPASESADAPAEKVEASDDPEVPADAAETANTAEVASADDTASAGDTVAPVRTTPPPTRRPPTAAPPAAAPPTTVTPPPKPAPPPQPAPPPVSKPPDPSDPFAERL